jgi:hypothetical protein
MIKYATLEYVRCVYKIFHKVFKKIQLTLNNTVNNYINYLYFKKSKSIIVLVVRKKEHVIRNVIFVKRSIALNVNKLR